MPAVAGVLLDHVNHDPAQSARAALRRELVVERRGGDVPVGDLDLVPVRRERIVERGVGGRVEVAVEVAVGMPAP